MRKKTNRVIIIDRRRRQSKARRKESREVGQDQEINRQTNAWKNHCKIVVRRALKREILSRSQTTMISKTSKRWLSIIGLVENGSQGHRSTWLLTNKEGDWIDYSKDSKRNTLWVKGAMSFHVKFSIRLNNILNDLLFAK